MNAHVITTAISSATALGLAVFVYFNNHKSALSRKASFLCASLGWFSLFLTLLYLTKNEKRAILYAKTLNAGAFFMPSFLLHFALVFTGRAEKEKMHIFASYALGFIFLLLIGTPLIIKGASVKLGHLYYPDAGKLYPAFLVMFSTVWLYAEYVLLKGYKACKDSVMRNQYKYIMLATTLGLLCGMNYAPLVMGFSISPIGGHFIIVSLGLTVYSIAKHRLMDITVVIRKTIIYSILIALISTIYLIGVLLIEKYFQSVFGYESIIITILTVSLVSIFFIPLRNSIQVFLDKFFFKGTLEMLSEEKERLEKEIRRSEKLKAVGTLAAGMAHEIKNPLTSIKTFTEFLPKKHTSPEFIEKFQKIVGPEVDKINDIVRQLLDFAKPTPLTVRDVNITILIDETLDLLNNSFLKYRINLIKNYTASCLLRVDPTQIKQVFLNIILNAIDAMKKNGGKLTIAVNSKNGDAAISIEDSGSGINKEDLERLFDPFFSTKDSGSGLGLSIVHGIIEKHKGRIEVASMPEKGTKFTIYLPLSR